jgi:hypothetical protein
MKVGILLGGIGTLPVPPRHRGAFQAIEVGSMACQAGENVQTNITKTNNEYRQNDIRRNEYPKRPNEYERPNEYL